MTFGAGSWLFQVRGPVSDMLIVSKPGSVSMNVASLPCKPEAGQMAAANSRPINVRLA